MNGVSFGGKHSYRDFGLTLKSRPTISPPKPKTVYIDIPASDGKLDLTESLTGDVKYENRTISCEFNVMGERERWAEAYSQILGYLHGKRMKITLDDDNAFYYIGRVRVNSWKSSRLTAVITVEADVEPYKYERYTDDWQWDSFSFETGVIREYTNLTVDGTRELLIPGDRKKVIPTFTASADMTVSYNENTFNLPAGTHRIVSILLGSGDNILTFSGHGTVSVDYRGGRL